MVANNHRNQHNKLHQNYTRTNFTNNARVKSEQKNSTCPDRNNSWNRRQTANRESARSYGPQHLGVIYASVSLTETSSDDEESRGFPESDSSYSDDQLLSVITPQQLRRSIMRKKVPPKTLKKPQVGQRKKELQVNDLPQTLRQPSKASRAGEEHTNVMSCQITARSLMYPCHQPGMKKGRCMQQTSTGDGRAACGGPPETTPKKPPSLAKDDINVVRQHLMVQRASISSWILETSEMQNDASTPFATPVRLVKKASIKQKVSVVVTRDVIGPPDQHQFFRRIRPSINQVDEYAPKKPPPLPKEAFRSPPENCPVTRRQDRSTSDSCDTHVANHLPQHHPTVSFAKLGSRRNPPPIPKERPPQSLPQRQRTYSMSSADSEEHYTEPGWQDQKLAEDVELHTSFRPRAASPPRSSSDSLSSSGSNSTLYFASKNLVMTKRTIRSTSVKRSLRYITPTFKRTRSQVYETFRVKKAHMRPAKPIGPRDIDPYARYCNPLCIPYKSKKRIKPHSFGRAVRVMVSCGGLAAIFRAIWKRK